jgi:ethanolamine utilization microcompartment shell protein EutS
MVMRAISCERSSEVATPTEVSSVAPGINASSADVLLPRRGSGALPLTAGVSSLDESFIKSSPMLKKMHKCSDVASYFNVSHFKRQ